MTVGANPNQQRAERVRRSLANPFFFGEAYFAPYDPNWIDVLPPFASDMLRFAVAARPWPHRAGVIMLPPEMLKTTLVSQVYPLWLTVQARVYKRLLRGMLMSEEEGMAKGNLSVIAWHILNNERLAHDFADGAGRPLLTPDPDIDIWRDDAIVVHRPGIVSRDPTWQAKGLDSKGVQGRRLDVFIGDDMVTPRNASSPAMRKQASDTLELQVETRIVEGGQIVIAGNFNDDKDLLSSLGRRPRYFLFRRPSIGRPGDPSKTPKDEHLFDRSRAQLLWPDNWTWERLAAEYTDKPNRFRRIHLLDPRAEQGERLQIGWVQQIAEADAAPLLKYATFYMGVDPAPGGEDEDLDFFNLTIGASTRGHFDIVRSLSVRADAPRQVNLLGELHDAYNRIGNGVAAIGGAKVAMDRYFRGSVAIKRPDLKHKLEDITIPEAEAAKEVRLEALGPKAQAGWLRVWESAWRERTADSVDQFQELTFEEEWREFPYGAHDDRLDGCDVAIRCMEQRSGAGTFKFRLAVAGS